ncbi:MAG: hypothetical protein J6Y17_00225 [Elusimicrobiaceae bacterium]|nr:hypothetical protein [Elusimicrobiaceae bacterium]
MKKILYVAVLLGLFNTAGATKLPENMYFKAMKQEMDRSLKKLRHPGSPKPFYIAYKLENLHLYPTVAALLGASYPSRKRDDVLSAYAWVDVGNAHQDSMGYVHDAYYAQHAYRARRMVEIPKGYEAIRQNLWQLTDQAYVFATEVFEQKQAYLRTKAADSKTQLPDFVPQKQSSYIQEIQPAPVMDEKQLTQWVEKFSARGKQYPFLEQFYLSITPVQREVYYLNSLGGFYQVAFLSMHVQWKAKLRNKDGFKQTRTKTFWLPLGEDTEKWEEFLSDRTQEFLDDLQTIYDAIPGQNYLGPVLLASQAAGPFLESVFVKNIQNLKKLLPEDAETLEKSGSFNDKLNQRVISNVIDLYDRPDWDMYDGWPLGGFMPVDDEGVAAQTLQLTQNGKLVDLPRSSRPLEKGAHSNGHARLTPTSLPRERLTNLFVEARAPKTWEELQEELIQKCKELGLEYGYILYDFPTGDDKTLAWVQRLYVDGKTEPVYGLQVNDLTPRALRDIRAAGDKAFVMHTAPGLFKEVLPTQSIISPALLLEELELSPDNKKADQKPFVPKP